MKRLSQFSNVYIENLERNVNSINDKYYLLARVDKFFEKYKNPGQITEKLIELYNKLYIEEISLKNSYTSSSEQV